MLPFFFSLLIMKCFCNKNQRSSTMNCQHPTKKIKQTIEKLDLKRLVGQPQQNVSANDTGQVTLQKKIRTRMHYVNQTVTRDRLYSKFQEIAKEGVVWCILQPSVSNLIAKTASAKAASRVVLSETSERALKNSVKTQSCPRCGKISGKHVNS